jgi:hypothetical protein
LHVSANIVVTFWPISTNAPNPTSDETLGLLIIPLATSTSTSIERPMTKLEMLQSQSRSLVAITNKLTVSVEEWEALLMAKVDVNIEKKCIQNSQFKGNYGCEVIMDVKFKAKVKDLLDF